MKRKLICVLLAVSLAIVSMFTMIACVEPETPDGGNSGNNGSTVVTPGGDKDNDGENTEPEKPTTATLNYKLLDNDTYEVSGYEGTPTKIVIPSEYNGKKVTSIGSGAFEDCSSLTSITIPDSVTSIGSGAFALCLNLTSVTLGNSLTSIGSYAFMNCIYLIDITIPDSVISIEGGAFDRCYSLTSITLGNSVTSIGRWAFEYCSSLISITIPDSVTSIGDNAFDGCYRLVEIYNLSSLEITKGSSENGYIGYYALDVYTDKNTPSKLTKENDFVIHTDGEVKTLIGYFGDKTEITISGSVTSIGYRAFYNCISLTSITIPDSVTSIGSGAFSGCSGLTSITIPDSVTSIGSWAFNGCSNLTTIYCEAESQPSGWDSDWRYNCSADIIWGYKGE